MTLSKATARDGGVADAWQPGSLGLVSDASFWMPIRSGVGSGWIEHAPFAFWLIQALRPRCFVELGSYTGYSHAAVCQAVQRLGTGTACYAIDTWHGDDHAGFYGESVFEDLQAFNERHFSPFSRLVRSTFSDASRTFVDGSIDLLHIDGRHGYDDVKADFEEWQPKLAPGAVVLFHDITVRERDFGVFRFWGEVSRDRPSFEFLHGHGLGVLGSDEVASPRLRTLFQAAEDHRLAAELRDAYARLGGALTAAYALHPLEMRVAAAESASREHQERPLAVVQERDATITSLNAQVADILQAKAAFEGGCHERDGVIQKLNAQIVELTKERAAFEGGCRERDAVIMSLHAQVSDLREAKAAFEDGCQERDAVLLALHEDCAVLVREKAAFDDGCRERDLYIDSLHAQVRDLQTAKAAFEDGCHERDADLLALRGQIGTHAIGGVLPGMDAVGAMRKSSDREEEP